MINNINKIFMCLFFINVYCPDNLSESSVVDKDRNIKLQESQQLIKNGISFFSKNSLEFSCQEFLYNPIWRKGDLYISIYDSDGTCYAHGDEDNLIWHNFSSLTDITKTPLIKSMFQAGDKGGTVIYFWNNSYKISFVKTTNKNGKNYVFEVGYFPQDAKYACVEMVALMKKYINQSSIKEVTGLLSDNINPLSIGEIEPFIYDLKGYMKAGNNPILIGQNLINAKDDRGMQFVQEFIKIAKNRTGKGWFSYLWKGEEKKCYIERAIDPKTKEFYILGAAYYPNENYKTVENFVAKASQSILDNGPGQAFSDFNSKSNGFIRGNLTIFAYDLKGICKANGKSPNSTNQNFYNTKNIEGRYIVREMINLLKNKRTSWISYANANSFANAYIQKVTTGSGETFIVGCEFYPSIKKTLTETLVSEAAQYLINNPTSKAFRLFSLKHSWFHWGEQYIFIYDIKGTCLVNGFKTNSIWRNFIRTSDQNDKLVVGNLISKALDGGGWDTYNLLNSTKNMYVQSVSKDLPNGEYERYIIGSGYFA